MAVTTLCVVGLQDNSYRTNVDDCLSRIGKAFIEWFCLHSDRLVQTFVRIQPDGKGL